MLGDSPLYVNIPVEDLQEAKHFYEGILGVSLVRENEDIVYRAGNSRFAIYPSRDAGEARHTLGSFIIDDIEGKVAQLRSCGVAFQEYDLPGLKTVDGVAHLPPDKVAWFEDPDGNILSLVQEGGKSSGNG